MMKRFTIKWRRWIAVTSTLIGVQAALMVQARAAVDVVASIPELAALAKEVGGEDVTVYSIAKPNRDYHAIESRPSDVARLSRADLVVRVGMDLDSWMTGLINATGNNALRSGGRSFVDASTGVPKIEVPQGQISGASGDVHPEGNPHYYYDPVYAIYAARNIVRGLIRVDAPRAAEYRANYSRFRSTMMNRVNGWKRELAPYAGRPVVTYHRNYNYFLRRFGIRPFGTMEPRPGIPPSARHINALLQNMKRNKVKGILIEGIYPRRYPNLLARQIGSQVVVAPYSVGSLGAGAYANLIDALVKRTKQAVS
jgi:zinc/manganese transport system substrate-binding protein